MYNYVSPEEYKIAEDNGLDKHTVYNRVYIYGWTIERAITEPKRQKPGLKQWLDIAEKNGIKKQTFYSRIYILKWRYLRAATTLYSGHAGRKPNYSREVIETYKKNGISAPTFQRRIREGWSVKDASTIKTMTQQEVLDKMHASNKKNNKFNVYRRIK